MFEFLAVTSHQPHEHLSWYLSIHLSTESFHRLFQPKLRWFSYDGSNDDSFDRLPVTSSQISDTRYQCPGLPPWFVSSVDQYGCDRCQGQSIPLLINPPQLSLSCSMAYHSDHTASVNQSINLSIDHSIHHAIIIGHQTTSESSWKHRSIAQRATKQRRSKAARKGWISFHPEKLCHVIAQHAGLVAQHTERQLLNSSLSFHILPIINHRATNWCEIAVQITPLFGRLAFVINVDKLHSK